MIVSAIPGSADVLPASRRVGVTAKDGMRRRYESSGVEDVLPGMATIVVI